jgi:MscS family membrane protein
MIHHNQNRAVAGAFVSRWDATAVSLSRRLLLLAPILLLIAQLSSPLGSFAAEELAPAPPPKEAERIATEKDDAALRRQRQPTFGLDRVEFLQQEIGGYPLWQYAASLLWIFGAFLVAALVDILIKRALMKLAARSKTDFDDKLIAVIHKPIKLIVFLLMLQLGVQAFDWVDWAEKLMSGLFAVAIAGCVTYLVLQLVDVLVGYVHQKFFPGDAELSKLLMPILGKSIKVFIIVIAALTTAQYLGLPITSVIAGLGIGGIAIALAAQNTLSNVFGTVTILADRPFRVGDRVKVDSHEGFIETIGLRSTRLRTLEGHLTVIPNKIMADSAIVNISARPNIRHLMTLNITYGTSAEKMKLAVETLREIYKNHPLTHDAIVYWRDFGSHSLDILVVYWCKTTDFKEFLKSNEEINMEIKRRFEAAGIEFAFPTQTIHLESSGLPTAAQS